MNEPEATPTTRTTRTVAPEAPTSAKAATAPQGEPEAPAAEAAKTPRTSKPEAAPMSPMAHQGELGASSMDHTSAPAPAATSLEPTPQLDLDFSPRPEPKPSAPELEMPQAALPSAGDLNTLLGPIVRLLGEVVGETVRQSVEAAVAQMQQVHARERDELTQRFEAALERQDSRLRELLEHQDARLKATLAQQARQHIEDMRALVGDVLAQRPTAVAPAGETTGNAVLEELQETLRLGFGEVRGALDRHHHELMNIVRAELRPLAQAALAHLNRPTSDAAAAPTPKLASDGPSAAPTPPARASPARPTSAHDERASSQRRHATIQEFDDDELDDRQRRPPRCHVPDDADVSHLQPNP